VLAQLTPWEVREETMLVVEEDGGEITIMVVVVGRMEVNGSISICKLKDV